MSDPWETRGALPLHFLAKLGVSRLASVVTALTLSGAIPVVAGAQQQTAAAPSLAFDGVTVVDVEHGRLIPAQRVVIAGNHIKAVGAVGAVKIPNGAQVVNGRGKYLIPGLWDMHVHVSPVFPKTGDTVTPAAAYRAFYPLFLVYGVTGVREMSQLFAHSADSFRVRQRAIAAGTRLGPRAIGPVFNIFGNETQLRTPDDMRHFVDSLKAAGVAFLKFNNASNNTYFALLREARRVGLSVVGHTVVSSVEAADSGQRGIEHLNFFRPCWPTGSTEQCTPVAAAFIRNGTWLTPTLAIGKHWSLYDSSAAQAVIRTLRDLGVTRFLAGSDFNYGHIFGLPPLPAGSSLLEELVLLTKSGLAPVEALQAATLNPAKFLGAADSLGSVTPGKLADLVLLDADPLADISNVKRIRAVVANGRYLERATLDSIAVDATRRVEAILNN